MIAYLDCFSGISGDMLLGALIDAGLSLDDLRTALARLPLSGYEIAAQPVNKRGITATQVVVKTERSPHRRGLAEILAIIDQAELPQPVRERARRTFTRLAEAEASVHGQPVEQVHFHELGAVDAVVDIVGAFWGLHQLDVREVYASPLPLGGGWVETAHGRLPVPAPATAALLKGVATYGGPVEAELVTPTGAAIVTTLTRSFGPLPPMTIKSVGSGAGTADLPHPNLLRLFLGEAAGKPNEETLMVLEANLDDMNPEFFEHLMEGLFAAGALDVFYTPIVMKKSRPATLVSVLANPERSEQLTDILFRETSTLGVRTTAVSRRCLEREWQEVNTEYGRVRVKVGKLGGEAVTAAPEYEDCRKLAQERGVPVKEIYEAARAAFRKASGAPPREGRSGSAG